MGSFRVKITAQVVSGHVGINLIGYYRQATIIIIIILFFSRYDPRADQWMNGPALTTARNDLRLFSDGVRLLAIGGYNTYIFNCVIIFYMKIIDHRSRGFVDYLGLY